MTADINDRVTAAHNAFLDACDRSPEERANWLYGISSALECNASKLIAIAHEETGLLKPRLENELARTAFQLRFLADEIRNGGPLDLVIDHEDENWGMGPRPDIRRQNIALGAVGVFGASNFPFAFSVIGGDSAAAIAAGCAVIHKIHEAHFRLGNEVAEIVVSALDDAGAPRDMFSVIHTREEGAALVKHPLIKAIGFTGSQRAGRILFDMAMQRSEPIPFYGELGSINPVFVSEGRWSDRPSEIISAFVASFNMGVGQFCTKPGLLFLPEAAEEKMTEFVEALGHVDAGRMLSDTLAAEFRDARERIASELALNILATGKTGAGITSYLYKTDISDFLKHSDRFQTELFGPASIIVIYDKWDDVIAAAKSFEGQLTCTLHADVEEDVSGLISLLERRSGRLVWNSWPTGVSVSYAQHHGGPYPATTHSESTSVGTSAIHRFMRPVAYQGMPDQLLPPALRDSNPWGMERRVNGKRVSF